MSLRTLRAIGGATLLCAVAACSSDSSSPSGPSPSTTFPVQFIDLFGSTGTQLPTLGSNAMNFGGSNINLAAGATPSAAKAMLAAHMAPFAGGKTFQAVLASPTCVPDQSAGSATDTDGDGVPDDATLTFTAANCTVYDTATGDAQLIRGVYHIRDTGNNVYGFQVDITDLHVRNYNGSSPHDFTDISYNATESANVTTTNGTYHLVLHAVIAQGDDSSSTGQDVRYDFTDAYAANSAISFPNPLPNGTFTISGTLDATVTQFGIPVRVVLDLVTPSTMSYGNACGDVSDGNYEMRVHGNPSEGLLIHFDSCNSYWEPLGAGAL